MISISVYNTFMAKLKITDLNMTYLYGATAISELSFECGEGETVSVLGGKESGKTSLVNAVSGLYKVTGGRIELVGDITFSPIKERRITVLHNGGGFFEKKTVRYNLLYPLRIRKTPKAEANDILLSACAKTDVEKLLDEKVFKLTGEERVRVLLARLFIHDAEAYLIDNIFSSLPSYERKQTFFRYAHLIKELNKPCVFTTDDPNEAFALGDRTVVLNYGTTAGYGTRAELLDSPSTLFGYKYVQRDVTCFEAELLSGKEGFSVNIINKIYPLDSGRFVQSVSAGDKVIASVSFLEGDDFVVGEGVFDYESDVSYVMHVNGQLIRIPSPSGRVPTGFSVKKVMLFDLEHEKLLYKG